ncbi:MAG: type VII secretion integral membrane protein EccD [Gordonia sp. (in: high G+C Gram-positive bacteria)]|uniref:type VII secretion integral membrane protein EccD n=1 Tax=Gordonia sp. (in: high G+C Gram-positive bacteria) TaxID=84139 RepID=UPI003C72DA18
MTVFVEPDLVRISILGGRKQLDVGLPTEVPIATLLPDLLVALKVPDSSGSDSPSWTLACVDGARLAPTETLAQAGILDGDLLMVRADRPRERSALVDDVADGVAISLTEERTGWTASASRTIGYVLFVLAATAAIPVGLAASAGGGHVVIGTIAAVGAAIALTIAVAGARLGVDPQTGTVLTWGACAMAGLAAAVAASHFSGGAQTAVAAIAAGLCAVIGYRPGMEATATAMHTGITTAAILIALGGTLAAVSSMPLADVAAVSAAVGVAVVLMAPRLAIVLARLPLPAVPMTTSDPSAFPETASVDGVEALRLSGHDPLGAIADLALGDLSALARRAGIAASFLTGILAGSVVVTGIATVIVAANGGTSTVTLAYCGSIVAAVAARGRTHTDQWQSGLLVAAAGITAVSTAVAVLFTDGGPSPLSVFVALLGFAVAALLLGCVAAGAEYTPPAVRLAEILEYAALIAVVPLLFWVLDVYRTVRQL